MCEDGVTEHIRAMELEEYGVGKILILNKNSIEKANSFTESGASNIYLQQNRSVSQPGYPDLVISDRFF